MDMISMISLAAAPAKIGSERPIGITGGVIPRGDVSGAPVPPSDSLGATSESDSNLVQWQMYSMYDESRAAATLARALTTPTALGCE